MRSSTLPAAVLLATLLACSSVSGQVPEPECPAPARPEQLGTMEDINAYARLLETFQTCIMDFAREQERLSQMHGDAANQAIERWNTLVASLNAATQQPSPEAGAAAGDSSTPPPPAPPPASPPAPAQ